MISVQKSKFHRSERTFFLKQAAVLSELNEQDFIGKIEKLFMSENYMFFIYKEPQFNMPKQIMDTVKPLLSFTPLLPGGINRDQPKEQPKNHDDEEIKEPDNINY